MDLGKDLGWSPYVGCRGSFTSLRCAQDDWVGDLGKWEVGLFLETSKAVKVTAISLLWASCTTISYRETALFLFRRQWLGSILVRLNSLRSPHPPR